MIPDRREWFLWLLGQDDNIGDVVLRRRLLRSCSAVGTAHVYVGRASDGYVEALTHSIDCVVYRDSMKWYRSGLRAASSRKFGFAFNPGEVRANALIGKWYLKLIPLLALAKLRGGAIVSFGLGIKPESAGWLTLIRHVTRSARSIVWRDELSPRLAGFGKTRPDLAFDEVLEVPKITAKDTIALTFRGDRVAPSQASLMAIQHFARSNGMKLCAFAQVRSDTELTERISRQLGIDSLGWPLDRSHLDQELLCRALFERSAVVISDRLHALIMATTHGAHPIGLTSGQDDKLARHLSVVGMSAPAIESDGHDFTELLSELQLRFDQAAATASLLSQARAGVQELDSLLKVIHDNR